MTVANKPSTNYGRVIKAKEHNISLNKDILPGSIDYWGLRYYFL